MCSHLNDHVHFMREFATLVAPNGILLQHGMTVQFDWKRFLSELWPITLEVVTTPQDLGRCHLPWYYGPSNSEVGGDDPDASPFILADMPTKLAWLNPKRQADIKDKELRLRIGTDSTSFPVPVYAPVERSELIALDRCHRLAALVISGLPFSVTFCKVEGPLERACLPDLRHYGA